MSEAPTRSCETPRAGAVGWLFAALIAAALIGSSVTEAHARLPFSACIFRNLTGLPCPGCGMTRGFVAMGHGRLGDAWRANTLSPFAYAVAWGCLAHFALAQLFPALRRVRVSRRLRWSLFAVVFLAMMASWSLALVRHFSTACA